MQCVRQPPVPLPEIVVVRALDHGHGLVQLVQGLVWLSRSMVRALVQGQAQVPLVQLALALALAQG